MYCVNGCDEWFWLGVLLGNFRVVSGMIFVNSKKLVSEVSNFIELIFIVCVLKDYFFFGLGVGLFFKLVWIMRML